MMTCHGQKEAASLPARVPRSGRAAGAMFASFAPVLQSLKARCPRLHGFSICHALL
jgi:hypothetical protein